MSSGTYTVVLTGRYGEERRYLKMDADGNSEEFYGYPPAAELRNELTFGELPEATRQRVLEIYRERWNISG